ncbi:MAG: hypothetical protein GKR95_22815 [Gammaproteobacteria bacterium]|nr:hypothetical protein [Gammaproteobacteria bacterium]
MSANIQNLKDLQREARKIDRGADQFQLQKDRFAPHRTRLNQSICRSLGEKARPFLIQTVQRKPWVGYELICDPDSIKIDP